MIVLKTIFFTIAIVTAISLIYYYREPIGDGLAAFAEVTKKLLKTIFGFIGEGLGDGILRSAAKPENRECMQTILREGGNSLIHGMATSTTGQPNPDVALLSNQLVHGALTQQPHQTGALVPGPAPVPTTTTTTAPTTASTSSASARSATAMADSVMGPVAPVPVTAVATASTTPAKAPEAPTRTTLNPDLLLAADSLFDGAQHHLDAIVDQQKGPLTDVLISKLQEKNPQIGCLGPVFPEHAAAVKQQQQQAAKANREEQRQAAIRRGEFLEGSKWNIFKPWNWHPKAWWNKPKS